ncbi:hypothetical protein RRG08_001038 [Elysia crispata]|uniref:Uncharacterized protein n=1 Tax=Elysia crispata TaxID=231223 RepID=A0AAE1AW51_9GAST|nr:hypothetical protein RRG08_001038 [Elysia crispata]
MTISIPKEKNKISDTGKEDSKGRNEELRVVAEARSCGKKIFQRRVDRSQLISETAAARPPVMRCRCIYESAEAQSWSRGAPRLAHRKPCFGIRKFHFYPTMQQSESCELRFRGLT